MWISYNICVHMCKNSTSMHGDITRIASMVTKKWRWRQCNPHFHLRTLSGPKKLCFWISRFEHCEWSHVLFIDGPWFNLECDTRRVLVWRERDTRNNPKFVQESSQYIWGWFMVWGGSSKYGCMNIIQISIWRPKGIQKRNSDHMLYLKLQPFAIPFF